MFSRHFVTLAGMKHDFDTQYKELTRGSVEVIEREAFKERLKQSIADKKPLRIKLGCDPSVPDLHLGHTVILQKLRQFQDFGHQVIFLIGDFTGLIGDPSGKNKTRPILTKEDVAKNAKTYEQQVFKILKKEGTEVAFNSSWMEKMAVADFIRLTSMENVARMLERDDFEKRYKGGQTISIHEFLYPLIQGYDSVELKADIELGGTDQKFNLLMGRQIQKEFKQKPQIIMTMPLLAGTDGEKKMSKSLNNYIGITEPADEIFGKIMSISDELMWSYYELLSAKSLEEIANLRRAVESGNEHPKEAKVGIAKEIAARFHDEKAAETASTNFDLKFRQNQAPENLPEITIPCGSINIVTLIKDHCQAVKSAGEAKRLVQQGAVKLNEKVLNDVYAQLDLKSGQILKIGKKRWFRLNQTKDD